MSGRLLFFMSLAVCLLVGSTVAVLLYRIAAGLHALSGAL